MATIQAKNGNFITQKHVSENGVRVFVNRVEGDINPDDWMEITAEEKAELEKEK